MAEGSPAPVRERPPRVLAWVVQVGFLTFFGVVVLLFGLWFGVELIKTQQEGIAAINAIQQTEYAQAQQMAETNQRIEATQEALRVTNDRIDRLSEQLATLSRLAVLQGDAP